jgi:hypothetical protein
VIGFNSAGHAKMEGLARIVRHLNRMPPARVTIRWEVVRHNHPMSDIASIAVAGMAASTARFEASAQRVARDPRADIAKELVSQKFAAADFEANMR